MMPTSIAMVRKDSVQPHSRFTLDRRAILSWTLIMIYTLVFWTTAFYWTMPDLFH